MNTTVQSPIGLASNSECRAAFVNWPVVFEEMDAAGLDALVAVSAASTFYLSGCYDDQLLYDRDRLGIVVVPRQGEATYLTCISEESVVRSATWLDDVRTYRQGGSPIEALATLLAEKHLERATLGIETEFFPIAHYSQLARRLPKATLREGNHVLARARWVKMPAEIDAIRTAVVTADQAVHAAWQRCHVGDSERQIQARMIEELARRGADRVLMRIASGPETNISHHDPSDRQLEQGDLVTSVFAGFWSHYWSDNERMGTVGPASATQRQRHAVVCEGLDRTIELIRPGIEVRELYDCPATVFRRHGDATRRPHMGHGMPRTRGHEDPMIQPNVYTLLEPNMLFMLEQSYRANGERYTLSHLVQVTDTGHLVLDDWWDISELFVF